MIEICKFYEPSHKHTKIFKVGRIKIKAVYVPSGTLNMGYGKETRINHSPQHQVKINQGFWITTSPISKIDYFKIMRPWSFLNLFVEEKNSPKINLNKTEINDFLSKLNKRSLSKYKWCLPTEPQWEYAAKKNMFESNMFEWTADSWYIYPRNAPAEEPHVNDDYGYYDNNDVVIKESSIIPYWREREYGSSFLRHVGFRLIKLYEKGDL